MVDQKIYCDICGDNIEDDEIGYSDPGIVVCRSCYYALDDKFELGMPLGTNIDPYLG